MLINVSQLEIKIQRIRDKTGSQKTNKLEINLPHVTIKIPLTQAL